MKEDDDSATPSPNHHLDQEWQQAWEHYRHLETQRSRYLAFYFSALFASIGVMAALFKDVDEKNLAVLFTATFLLLIVNLFLSINIFLSIKKTGLVLLRYGKIMETVRSKYNYKSSSDFPFEMSDFSKYPKYMRDNESTFGVHSNTEQLIVFFSIILMLSISFMIYLSFFEMKELLVNWQKFTFAIAGAYALTRSYKIFHLVYLRPILFSEK